jgi:hypothetical protein
MSDPVVVKARGAVAWVPLYHGDDLSVQEVAPTGGYHDSDLDAHREVHAIESSHEPGVPTLNT